MLGRWSSDLVRRVIGLSLAACLCVLGQSAVAEAASPTSIASSAAQVSASVDPFMASELAQYAGSGLGPFEDGSWSDAESLTWACNQGGPVTAAATLYVLGGESNATYLQEAEETINTAIADQQVSNGGFVTESGDTTSEPTSTAWFAAEEGTVYHLLAPYLDPSTQAAWQASLAAAAQYLITDGDLVWYANGNLNDVYIEVEWLAWQATGETQFLTAYNQAWATAMDPDQSKFPGAGWITVTSPTQADGSDGSGYFTETGAGGTGWDPYYTMLQLDAMARLYLLSGDPRALRATNMLWNQEATRLDTDTWALDQSDGTRHTGTEGATGFLDSAMFVLALEGNRSSLLPDLSPFLTAYENWYSEDENADSPSFRRAFGNSISVIALSAALASPSQRSLVNRYGLLGSAVTIPGVSKRARVVEVAIAHSKGMTRTGKAIKARKTADRDGTGLPMLKWTTTAAH
jgi:hypothetical protein